MDIRIKSDIKTIPIIVNQVQAVWFPDFSEIIGLSFDDLNINILYQYNYELAGNNKKIFNIRIMDSKNTYSPPSEFYKFFSIFYFSKIKSEMVPIPISEKRDEKLKEIL